MSDLLQTAKGSFKASIQLRIKRAGSNEWEDGPTANAVQTNLPFLLALKLRIYTRLIKLLSRLQSKLEEMQK